jgi:hypothetical protein
MNTFVDIFSIGMTVATFVVFFVLVIQHEIREYKENRKPQ